MKKVIFCIVLAMSLYGCIDTQINQSDQVIAIEKSNFPENGKYYVSTSRYHFFTDSLYSIGDEMVITRVKK